MKYSTASAAFANPTFSSDSAETTTISTELMSAHESVTYRDSWCSRASRFAELDPRHRGTAHIPAISENDRC